MCVASLGEPGAEPEKGDPSGQWMKRVSSLFDALLARPCSEMVPVNRGAASRRSTLVTGADNRRDPMATDYVAHRPDANGVIHYRPEENATWKALIERQLRCIRGRACDEYLDGLAQLALPHDHIPQLQEISQVLQSATGWQLEAVPALIDFDTFFALLARQCFPVATFIRRPEEMDYLQEPDIFHEIFGHCPLLTNPDFAHFTARYGQLGLAATPPQRVYLARLYWFTVEFGLVDTPAGRRIYGGGILSSPKETRYALSNVPQVASLEPLEVLRTPYRIDILQPKYFVIHSLAQLYELAQLDIMGLIDQAQRLGLYPPLYPDKRARAAIDQG